MIELPLIFVAGFLGSSHCIGMCGPFAILVGNASKSWKSGLGRQLSFSLGRIFTYTMLGVAAGYGGLRLADYTPQVISVPAVMSIIAGTFLIYQGLLTAGVLPSGWSGSSAPCLAGGLLAGFLRRPDSWSVFIAGLFTGFLPCGLVYGFLGMAASSRSLVNGALVMAAFGLGTVPVMVATGVGGGMLTVSTRARVLRLAAWCIVIAGLLSIWRGVNYLGATDAVEACPLCD